MSVSFVFQGSYKGVNKSYKIKVKSKDLQLKNGMSRVITCD